MACLQLTKFGGEHNPQWTLIRKTQNPAKTYHNRTTKGKRMGGGKERHKERGRKKGKIKYYESSQWKQHITYRGKNWMNEDVSPETMAARRQWDIFRCWNEKKKKERKPVYPEFCMNQKCASEVKAKYISSSLKTNKQTKKTHCVCGQQTWGFVLFKKFLKRFYSLTFRERGREGGREGEKHQCVVASHVPPTGDLAHNPGMCPD